MKAFRARGRGSVALLLTLAVLWGFSSWSQGNLVFANSADIGVDAPIYDVDGTTPLAGSGFLAELYATAPGGVLQPVTDSITPFSTRDAAGYFLPLEVAIPGVPAGHTATVQVVAWRASDGPTFAAANHSGAHIGESATFDVGPLTSMGPPPDPLPAFLVGLQSFSLHVVVPEPSVFALGLLGGSLLALGRRRWCASWGRVKFKPVPP